LFGGAILQAYIATAFKRMNGKMGRMIVIVCIQRVADRYNER